MSPSTKNLRERTERVAEIISVLPGTSAEHGEIAAKVMNLLSSELSLAVKGLRESLEKQKESDHDQDCDGTGGDCEDLGCHPMISKKNALSSFDSKAKEILGESS